MIVMMQHAISTFFTDLAGWDLPPHAGWLNSIIFCELIKKFLVIIRVIPVSHWVLWAIMKPFFFPGNFRINRSKCSIRRWAITTYNGTSSTLSELIKCNISPVTCFFYLKWVLEWIEKIPLKFLASACVWSCLASGNYLCSKFHSPVLFWSFWRLAFIRNLHYFKPLWSPLHILSYTCYINSLPEYTPFTIAYTEVPYFFRREAPPFFAMWEILIFPQSQGCLIFNLEPSSSRNILWFCLDFQCPRGELVRLNHSSFHSISGG